jgi:hypothetical protein
MERRHLSDKEDDVMRTATIEVAGLLSTLSALGVQKQLVRLPGQ